MQRIGTATEDPRATVILSTFSPEEVVIWLVSGMMSSYLA